MEPTAASRDHSRFASGEQAGAVSGDEGHGFETESAFARGLRVFSEIAANGSLTASSIASALTMPTSSVYRFLKTLKDTGMIEENEGRYRLAGTFMATASQGLDYERFATRSLPVLRQLVAETGETADFLMRSGERPVCVQEAVATSRTVISLRRGDPMGLHAGAEQRVLLAFAPRQVIDDLLSRRLDSYTRATLPKDRLLTSLEKIRQRKVAVSRGEYMQGVVAVGVPVFARHQVVGSIGVAGPEERCGAEWTRQAAGVLVRASLALSDIAATC
jgi:DNA-binding IclR family transcriptional regulator